MKKMLGITALFAIIMAILLTIVLNNVGHGLKQKQQEIEEYVGKNYIINKDTVFIVEYNMLKQSYIDDKGRAYSFALIKKTKPIPE